MAHVSLGKDLITMEHLMDLTDFEAIISRDILKPRLN